ncbi:NADPH-dependent FMN reductase [Virgibacillus soli]|uniref:NAD(P)H-dependent oxidoreductase n=1 Tax=Paracerasibacillus soli TaxID=480284 RepID=A0ABU5CNE1_9BACI|nr:NAD(P)H-dependent oxidoreductase [Virgibacillus soli]MDY0407883.1 NAD(P)H-dependent oxidoreductase [Virgibacillus soli]
MKLIGISGELTGWKATMILHHVLEAAKKVEPNLETELIEMKEYEIEFVRGEPLAYYNDDTFQVVNKILDADLLVFGTPIYQASMTGALKNLLDFFPVDAFKNKVTGIVTTGAIEKHFLVSEYQLRPILSYLKGFVPTSNVFVHNDAFNEINEIVDNDVLNRVKLLAEEMLRLQRSVASSEG